MYSWTVKLCFVCVLVFALRTCFAYGYSGNHDYKGNFNKTAFGIQVKTATGKAGFGNTQSDRHSTLLHQRRRKFSSMKSVSITRCEKTSCAREKRKTNATKRQGVKIIFGERTTNVSTLMPEGITSLASALKLLDNKKPTNDSVSRNGFESSKEKLKKVVNSTKSFKIPDIIKLSSFGKSLNLALSLENITSRKIESKLPKTALRSSDGTRKLRVDNKFQTSLNKLAQNQSFKSFPNVMAANEGRNGNKDARRMGTTKAKGRTQLGSKRQGWFPLKHRVGVPIPYGGGPVPLMLSQSNVQSYGPGPISLMLQPGKNGAPVPMLNQEMVDKENAGAFFEPFGTALNNSPLPRGRLPVSIPLNPDIGQAPVHISLPPKVHVPTPLSTADPFFIDGLHGDLHSNPVVQQIPVTIPVESPPKHVPFPVPYPVHVPPQVKHVLYPVPFPVKQPPEVRKIYYPIAFREPPQIKGIPIPVIVHSAPEVKSIPVPVRVPSPPRPVPVPVPSPPRVFVHRVAVPVPSPVEFHNTVSTTVSDLPPESLCMANPCANGGSCSSFLDSFRCHCPKGYKGRHCQEVSQCHPSPCKNYGSCTELEGDYECTCSRGFKGKNCEIIDPCYPQPCKNGAQCWSVGDTYSCSCRVGWMGNNCEVESKCLPINPCQNGGSCSEQSDVYKCSCSPGWAGISCEIPAAESQARKADIQTVRCSGCHVSAVCHQGRCACRAGFQGDGYNCYVN